MTRDINPKSSGCRSCLALRIVSNTQVTELFIGLHFRSIRNPFVGGWVEVQSASSEEPRKKQWLMYLYIAAWGLIVNNARQHTHGSWQPRTTMP